ncbi:MAG: yidA [Gemmataceae bacterium]|nr:yidA [Gemmataceae bacterium]
MRYLALAADYDGTIAHNGVVDAPTLAALARVRASGRKLILVTGRQLDELLRVFPQCDRFDRVVAENGALVYHPDTCAVRVLAEPPPDRLVADLLRRGVSPLTVGRTIVATVEPHEREVLESIRDLGLEWHVIFNKGSVMALPSGVNKATGLIPTLTDLGIHPEQVVGVGDAENDHAFLTYCGCAVAVANALPAVKDRADLVTVGARGAGVIELIDRLLADDLAGLGRAPDNGSANRP